jgi:serine/threonine protein phosphatase PrpC
MNAMLKTAAGNPENQDRGAIINATSGRILVIADGAGGRSGGCAAAEMAVEIARQHAHQLEDAAACATLLRTMDQQIFRDAIAARLIELVRYPSGALRAAGRCHGHCGRTLNCNFGDGRA